MNQMVRIVLAALMLEAAAGCAKRAMIPATGEATLVEVFSPAEVTVMATGVGSKAAEAEADARYQAVNFVLLGGTDPLLQRPEERAKFDSIRGQVLSRDSVMKFISWEDVRYQRRLKLEDGRLKLTKQMRVNRRMLTEYLVGQGVLESKDTIVEELGTPRVMVIPATTKDESPIDKLNSSLLLKKAAQIIESFLTANKYDVVVPEQKVAIDELVAVTADERGIAEDASYLYALSIGCDIYVTYTVDITSGTYETRKASVAVRTYETTTGRLLGTETGYSPEVATSSNQVVMEQAFNACMNNVLSRVSNYWKDDLAKGMQYKLVVKFRGALGRDAIQNLQFGLADMAGGIAKKTKENVISDKTMDLLLWIDTKEYDATRRIYSALEQRFVAKFPGYRMRKIVINRKLLVVEISK